MTKLINKFLGFVDETQHIRTLGQDTLRLFCAANGYSLQTEAKMRAKLQSLGIL